ncbi:MAG TPA: hypothetical protein VFC63_16010 [Blastocatellia bacterium]|nr:hypothetical protein [Blastocatellia bacterium]
MGEKYKAELQDKIREFGASNLRVYLNEDGLHPHYFQHLKDTFQEEGVKFVYSRDDANFVFEGNCDAEPAYQAGQVVAFFNPAQTLLFAGAL